MSKIDDLMREMYHKETSDRGFDMDGYSHLSKMNYLFHIEAQPTKRIGYIYPIYASRGELHIYNILFRFDTREIRRYLRWPR